MTETTGVPKRKYTRNFLSKVVLRVDFSVKIELNFLQSFSSDIRSIFPIHEQKENIIKSFMLNGKTGEIQQESGKVILWNYFDETKSKKLEVSSDHVFIEYEKYSDSTELAGDVEKVICKFIEYSKVETIARLGLRYVNDVSYKELEGKDWTKLFPSSLLGAINFASEHSKKYARAMGQLVFKETDADITFNFGVWNSDYPNAALRPNFVLDIDCYSRLPFEANIKQLVETVKSYNGHAEKLFEASVTDDLRDMLNTDNRE